MPPECVGLETKTPNPVLLPANPSGTYNWEDGLYFEDVGYDSVSWTTPGTLSDDYDPDGHGLSYRRMFIQSIAGDTLGTGADA